MMHKHEEKEHEMCFIYPIDIYSIKATLGLFFHRLQKM